jgi:hypothetical protein
MILSGTKTIEKTRLFWENCFFTPQQAQLIDTSYAALQRGGFQYVWIFDNIGNLMLDECSFKEARSINTYLFAQRFCGIGETMPMSTFWLRPRMVWGKHSSDNRL